MTSQNKRPVIIGAYQPRSQSEELEYQSSTPQKRNIRGGYQPIADAQNQDEEKVLPPVPRGSSGESGRSGYRVATNKK
ncbi:MAG: hypothetical protein LBK06_01670 [Planctomycetaceae bacterium]|jgi:hypothetical protein|nr:hypothetical protein [Planctomycetaceae bacterium]